MKKISIIYGSTTGTTESIAAIIADILRSNDNQITTINVRDAKSGDLTNNDLLLLGSSTWGDGELQDDFAVFLPTLELVDLANKKTFVFGCGETSWPQFCAAVDIIQKTVEDCGAIIGETLKIDGDAESNKTEIENWAQTLL